MVCVKAVCVHKREGVYEGLLLVLYDNQYTLYHAYSLFRLW